LALVNGDIDSLVEDVQATRLTPIKTEARLYSSITANLYYVGQEVEVGVDILNEKLIETVEPLK